MTEAENNSSETQNGTTTETTQEKTQEADTIAIKKDEFEKYKKTFEKYKEAEARSNRLESAYSKTVNTIQQSGIGYLDAQTGALVLKPQGSSEQSLTREQKIEKELASLDQAYNEGTL